MCETHLEIHLANIALQGVFAKNERRYISNYGEKISAFDRNQLLLSVASKRRKLFETSYIEERSVHTNSESCNFQLGSLKNQFNSKQIIQILQPFIIYYFSTHSYIVNIS